MIDASKKVCDSDWMCEGITKQEYWHRHTSVAVLIIIFCQTTHMMPYTAPPRHHPSVVCTIILYSPSWQAQSVVVISTLVVIDRGVGRSYSLHVNSYWESQYCPGVVLWGLFGWIVPCVSCCEGIPEMGSVAEKARQKSVAQSAATTCTDFLHKGTNEGRCMSRRLGTIQFP